MNGIGQNPGQDWSCGRQQSSGPHRPHGGHWSHQHGGGPWGGGPPPWVQALFGGSRGFKTSSPRGPKVRRGDVRTAILDVLTGQPMNGYQVIQQIAERSHGYWKPSPGSVYPTLQQLEDEGLIATAVSAESAGRKTFELTSAGRTYAEEHAAELAATWRPFEAEAEADEDTADLKSTISQVAAAVWQVAVSGTPHQQDEARQVLAETRRQLYNLLADGDDEE